MGEGKGRRLQGQQSQTRRRRKIGCDNDLCLIECFHFNCAKLNGKHKGKWFFPKCREEKPTNMKSKAQFLKELEKYNKEKADKVK